MIYCEGWRGEDQPRGGGAPGHLRADGGDQWHCLLQEKTER